MGSRPSHAAIALLVVVLLSACGNIPRPFEPTTESVIPLPETPSTLGVGVLPLIGVNDPQAIDVAKGVADALRQIEIPAEAIGEVGQLGFSLQGKVSVRENHIIWRLVNKTGVVVEEFDLSYPVAVLNQTPLPEDTIDSISRDVADRLRRLWSPIAPPPEAPPLPGAGLTITIRPPAEAPGDGAAALVRILANRLVRQGFEPALDNPDFILAGTVDVTAYDAAQDDISIVWKVLDGRGAELGEVRLDNRVPRGELDGTWGLVAEAIIDSAFPGLFEIMATSAPTRNQ